MTFLPEKLGSVAASRKIIFIRHGETALNRTGAVDGRSDLGLTEKGIEQALRLRAYLMKNLPTIFNGDLSRLLGSPSERAIQTSRKIFPEMPLYSHADFMEVDVGALQGKTWHDAVRQSLLAPNHSIYDRFPDGESFFEAQERALSILEQQLAIDQRHLIIVAHGGIISLMIIGLMGLNVNVFPFTEIDNCSCSIIDLYEGNTSRYTKIKMLNYVPV